MRLVKVDEIKLPQGFFEKIDNVPKFYEWLDTLPTVDAIEVVRCKDCRFCGYDEMFDEMWCNGKRVSADWICADGERRER